MEALAQFVVANIASNRQPPLLDPATPLRFVHGVDSVAQHATIIGMIKSFRHKGLEKFYSKGSVAGIQAKHAKRLRMQLAALDSAYEMGDMDIPGYHLHPLKGNREGVWSISVSGNWRLTFEFSDGNVYVLNYEDYH